MRRATKLSFAGLLALSILFAAVHTVSAEPNWRILMSAAELSQYAEISGCVERTTTLRIQYATPPVTLFTGTSYSGSYMIRDVCANETLVYLTWNGSLLQNPVNIDGFSSNVNITATDHVNNQDIGLTISTIWSIPQTEGTRYTFEFNGHVFDSTRATLSIGIIADSDLIDPYFGITTGTISTYYLRFR